MKEMSICVPVYKMKDQLCEKFLVEYLSHLMYQTFKDFEVVVSDQSEDDNLKNICDAFSYVLDIKHVRNTSGVKNAANNVNHAVKHAAGKIIKLLYVDDFFIDVKALEKIKSGFDTNPDSKWLIAGFTHSDQERTRFYNSRLPRYDQLYVNGDNSTGNPSNYAVRRECAIEMDENLLWIVDGEYFYRTYYHFGLPVMLPEVLVCFREHEDSKFMDDKFRELDTKERQYCVNKFSGKVEQKLIQYVN